MSRRERRPDASSIGTPQTGDGRPVEFFIDRSLGRKHLAQALEAHGLVVHTMASVYGERVAQELDDERWLADAGEHDWIVLMKDDAIRRRPAERDALSDARVRAFCLTNAQLRAAEQSARFLDNINRILRQAQKPGPYIYGVYTTGTSSACGLRPESQSPDVHTPDPFPVAPALCTPCCGMSPSRAQDRRIVAVGAT